MPVAHSVTIANGQTASGASQDIDQYAVVALELPAAFTGTSVSFSVSTDGTNYKTLARPDGTTYSVAVAADRLVPTAGALFVPVRYVKVVSNAAEGGARVVRLILDTDPVGGDTGGAASEAHLGQVGGHPAKVVATLTRPGDTTTYAAGDAMSDNATQGAATVLTFANVNRATGLGGLITSAKLIDSGNPAVKGPFELWLFSVAPAAQGDNAAFAPSDAEMLNLETIFPFTAAYAGATGTTGNSAYIADVTNQEFIAPARNLYGLVVVRGAVIPLASEVYTFVLNIYQD